jgi:hypothetical protein
MTFPRNWNISWKNQGRPPETLAVNIRKLTQNQKISSEWLFREANLQFHFVSSLLG